MKTLNYPITAMAMGLSALSLATHNYAQTPTSWGDAQANHGELKVSGAIRTRFQHKDFHDSASEGKNDDWRLADLKLVLNYENPNWIGAVDARCYQYDRLCDAVFLVNAWAGYKIDQQQRISVGLQSVDFGLGRFWGSSYYETLFNTLGYEDVHNLGVKYQLQNPDYQLTLGFYPRDGGNFKGTSHDASRYTGNFVEADDLSKGTHLEEKNMWIARASKNFAWNADGNAHTELGASYWYADLDNKKTHQTGYKSNWNIFTKSQLQNWQLLTVAGQQRIDNKDELMPDYSTLGAFDTAYQIANDANYLMTEVNYRVDATPWGITGIKPYLSYSHFFKDKSGDIDSNRILAGVSMNYKQIGVQAEYIFTRNDAMIAGNSDALGKGDHDHWNQMLYVALGYYF